jgi:hypothetical protein
MNSPEPAFVLSNVCFLRQAVCRNKHNNCILRHRLSGKFTTYGMISVIREVIARWNMLDQVCQSATNAAVLIGSVYR